MAGEFRPYINEQQLAGVAQRYQQQLQEFPKQPTDAVLIIGSAHQDLVQKPAVTELRDEEPLVWRMRRLERSVQGGPNLELADFYKAEFAAIEALINNERREGVIEGIRRSLPFFATSLVAAGLSHKLFNIDANTLSLITDQSARQAALSVDQAGAGAENFLSQVTFGFGFYYLASRIYNAWGAFREQMTAFKNMFRIPPGQANVTVAPAKVDRPDVIQGAALASHMIETYDPDIMKQEYDMLARAAFNQNLLPEDLLGVVPLVRDDMQAKIHQDEITLSENQENVLRDLFTTEDDADGNRPLMYHLVILRSIVHQEQNSYLSARAKELYDAILDKVLNKVQQPLQTA